MSIFTTLRDAVLGTTPQRVVQQRLAKIEENEVHWQKIADTLRPRAVPGIDGAPGNAEFEAWRCIEARWRARVNVDLHIYENHEGAAMGSGAQMGSAEAEARCRIREIQW